MSVINLGNFQPFCFKYFLCPPPSLLFFCDSNCMYIRLLDIVPQCSWMHTLIFFYSFFFVSICTISVVLFSDSPSLSLGKLSLLMNLSKPLFILFTLLFIFSISVSFFPLLSSLFKAVHYFKQKQWKTMQVSLWWDHSVCYFHTMEHMCHHVSKWAYTDMDGVITCIVLIKQV